ncbi:hypothetical protein TWF102_001249 [Orbilia oligospora]|uniref:Uncharacterized protein n=1 Tax=Orbilia oligospora TaxID=2813651 RepID=A0A7C8IYI0_ORBOL|nr:hypothetical protein TWF102_001249 [Orbilia oligospora]KAF3116240.1 hypothetical protein TWF103_009461 [Orbilia oligospora]
MVACKFLFAGFFAAVASAQTSSTCTPYSAPAGACPTAYDSCCAFLCAEAQVPFGICQPNDGTGEFATCTACAGGTATAIVTTTTTDTATGTATDTITGTGAQSTSTTTLTSTTTTCTSGNATAYTALPTPTYISGAEEGYIVLNGVFALGLLCAAFVM